MKIVKEHTKAIEDFVEFFSFLWGRLGFDMHISTIKERDEITLSQNTIIVKGFALTIQLVMVEARHAILANDGHARNLGKKAENVINLDPTRPIVESTLVWSDGGVTKIDVERIREEAKVHAREKKTKKPYLAKKKKKTKKPIKPSSKC
ncbi:hypothetical protein IGI04_003189 [Brassica rapa subsp. trilocularis]|uniref:Uncharacterized protein n=1 Tax=Brassica rapa subsp. trilocularis TaxID=1813537 RepID=A0ABQ7NXP9_BRACM|nr:hypothetical protein IGI04_003189 [Brassica rapa subsp. trilocularis]